MFATCQAVTLPIEELAHILLWVDPEVLHPNATANRR